MLEKPKKLNVTTQKQIKQIKLSLIGDSAVGKSTFVSKFITGDFKQTHDTTLGVQSANKIIENSNGSKVNITIWDFSGKIDFVQIRKQFYKETDVVIIFCDLSNKSNVQSLDFWVKQAKDNEAGTIFIVGNKQDLKKTDAQKASKQKGCPYFEISSKTGEGIGELIKKIMSETK